MPSPTPVDRRAADLRWLAEERWDILVVGGGIVGAGTLLDAASRGLRAALVEQDDIASGTSGRSSRLIHGGLRYLEQLRFGLVREALAERRRLLRLAPHLVRVAPFLFPIYGLPFIHRPFYGAGLTLYDVLGGRLDGGRHRHLGVAAALEQAPSLRRAGLQGALVYHDGIEDDARYALAVVRTAQRRGALAVTRAQALGPLGTTQRADGWIDGARVRDMLSGAEIEVRAERVIDATGVWAARGGPFGAGSVGLLPSRGSHLLVRRERIPSRMGMTIRAPGKVVFLVPWPGHWVIGTTDAPYHGPVDRPSASPAEVDEILAVVNRRLDVDLTHADIVGTYAGLRPLVAPRRDGSTLKVSREHRVRVEADGVVRIAGGKYTTYRVMARDAVDAALGPYEARRRPSASAALTLVGAADPDALGALAHELVTSAGLPIQVAQGLVGRHGTEATGVVALGRDLDLLRPLGAGIDVLEAEVAWAAREELALSLDDVLARRTRLAQELPDRGGSVAGRTAAILGAELGWEPGRIEREVPAYLASAHREFDVPTVANRSIVDEPATVTATADPFGEHG
jgi:glycerol-3-phosphate dehydrogenase